MRNITCLLIFALTACASQPDQGASSNLLEPYFTATAYPSNTPDIILPPTALATPTPFIYTVEAGDTFSELSEKFHVSQDDLQTANPDVDPNSMSIGATLLIPAGSDTAASGSTLTPVPVPITQATCFPTAAHGLGCFALIQNNTSASIEDVSAQITLLDAGKNVIAAQTAFTPLDTIPANSFLPAYFFFPNTPANLTVQVQLLSAIQGDASRDLPALLNNTIAQIGWKGLTAQLSGQISLPSESTTASKVWVAAVAFDKFGTVVGVKRWEGEALQPGASTTFNFIVASLGPAIDRVDFFVEAKR